MENIPVIMVVDDEWLNRELIEGYLQTGNYRIVMAHSGQQALKLAGSNPPDLAIIDVRMPGMDGYEVAKQLKMKENTQDIRIMMISGFEDTAEERQRASEAGADAFITRTSLMRNLLKHVESLLSNTQRQTGD